MIFSLFKDGIILGCINTAFTGGRGGARIIVESAPVQFHPEI